MFKRLMYLFTAGQELDILISVERKKRLSKEHEENAHRLNLCFKHRQEQNHSHYSEKNCAYCKLQSKVKSLQPKISNNQGHPEP